MRVVLGLGFGLGWMAAAWLSAGCAGVIWNGSFSGSATIVEKETASEAKPDSKVEKHTAIVTTKGDKVIISFDGCDIEATASGIDAKIVAGQICKAASYTYTFTGGNARIAGNELDLSVEATYVSGETKGTYTAHVTGTKD